jgi:ATP/ADP translocase/HEAT repeat protein
MAFRDALHAVRGLRENRAATKLLVMFLLFFLVLTTVGILRPVRNVLALDGLADTQFYKTYFVSAFVVLFAPVYNRLADRISWKRLIPGVAFFFAGSFLVFRLLYREGSALFGMVFYGWYDLYAAALVTQFFMATQLFFNSREAKKAYPFVIAGGSIGATVGGISMGVLAERVGAPNMLLVAGGIVLVFAVALSVVWAAEDPDAGRTRDRFEKPDLNVGSFRRIFSNPHVRLIATAVLLTVLVKQLVDYSFNEAVRTVGGRDAMGEFQGYFMAATQWTPILVLAALRPLLGRWGVGIAVFMLPVVMLVTNSAVAVAWGLWTAVIAKGADATFRYSAERTGREILYMPVPEELKLRAKAWIDVAFEKGVGKASSALLILALVSIMDYRRVAFVAVGLAFVGLMVAYLVRKEYVTTLRRSIEGRFASLEGVFASISGASTLPVIREALTGPDPRRAAFALELVERAGPGDAAELAPELHELAGHSSPEIRRKAVSLLADIPQTVDRETVWDRLHDVDERVRREAVRTLVMAAGDRVEGVCSELLEIDDADVRAATLDCLAGGDVSHERIEGVVRPFLEARLAYLESPETERRVELASAAGLMPAHPEVPAALQRLLADDEPVVVRSALASAARTGDPRFLPAMIDALGSPATRTTARAGLERLGEMALYVLVDRLTDVAADPRVRRQIPRVLAGIPSQVTVEALIHSYDLKETGQRLDDRTLRALVRLRRRHSGLRFDRTSILRLLKREVDAAARYAEAWSSVATLDDERPSVRLLRRALQEAQEERRASAFRWLGLVYPPEGMYRSRLAIGSGDQRSRANAIEWLETTVGHELFRRLQPLVEPARPVADAAASGGADPAGPLRRLWDDEDHWIGRCAMWVAVDLGLPGTSGELERFRPKDPDLDSVARRLSRRVGESGGVRHEERGQEVMDTIERVFLLQNIDLLRDAPTAQLALVATIATEVDVEPGTRLLEQGKPADALYVVVRGRVELEGRTDESLVAEEGEAFGTWALIETAPSLVDATASEPTHLLRIRRPDFSDLLADYPELGLGLLQGLAKRVRALLPA